MISRRALFAAATLPLAGCVGTLPPLTPTEATILQQVLGYLQTICKIVAEATAIEAVIATYPPGTVAVLIAQAVCLAVETAEVAPIASHPRVRQGNVIYAAVVVRGIVVPYAHLVTPAKFHRRKTAHADDGHGTRSQTLQVRP